MTSFVVPGLIALPLIGYAVDILWFGPQRRRSALSPRRG